MRLERPLPGDREPPRITELWVWTSLDPMTDVEGIMGAQLPGVGWTPLVTSRRHLAEAMRPVVEQVIASAADPRPVPILRHFVPAGGDVGAPERL